MANPRTQTVAGEYEPGGFTTPGAYSMAPADPETAQAFMGLWSMLPSAAQAGSLAQGGSMAAPLALGKIFHPVSYKTSQYPPTATGKVPMETRTTFVDAKGRTVGDVEFFPEGRDIKPDWKKGHLRYLRIQDPDKPEQSGAARGKRADASKHASFGTGGTLEDFVRIIQGLTEHFRSHPYLSQIQKVETTPISPSRERLFGKLGFARNPEKPDLKKMASGEQSIFDPFEADTQTIVARANDALRRLEELYADRAYFEAATKPIQPGEFVDVRK